MGVGGGGWSVGKDDEGGEGGGEELGGLTGVGVGERGSLASLMGVWNWRGANFVFKIARKVRPCFRHIFN